MELKQDPRAGSLVSALIEDGSLVEMVRSGATGGTRFCIFRDGTSRLVDEVPSGRGRRVPYSASNNLIRHGVVQFPSEPAEYGSQSELLEGIRQYIHRYVDLSALFEHVAAHYVLLSWVYDVFNELPYLRVRGDFGSGKSRFLLTVGSICYKPMFASGASTVSPLFRIIDAFRGTLVLDESDFRQSDEKSEIIKILNNGNARGFPVLRSEANAKHEYDPKAYDVYGPKIIATRGMFADRALESRCITEDLGLRPLRQDIPVTLPTSFSDEALNLRNKLLLFRFRNRHSVCLKPQSLDPTIEPRVLQIFAPLASMMSDEQLENELRELLRDFSLQLTADRGMGPEGQVLEILHELLATADPRPLELRAIRAAFIKRFGTEYQWKISSRWIGSLLRSRLQLTPRKSHGIYVIPPSEYPKLKWQFERYGIGSEKEEAA